MFVEYTNPKSNEDSIRARVAVHWRTRAYYVSILRYDVVDRMDREYEAIKERYRTVFNLDKLTRKE